MKINLYRLAQREPELTHATLRAYLKMTGWTAATDAPRYWHAPTQDATMLLPESPGAPLPQRNPWGVRDWADCFRTAIQTLATYEDKRIPAITVPYRVLHVLGSRRLAATDRQPGAFTTFFPYRDVLTLVLDMTLPPEPVAIRDVLGHAAFHHWELLEPETAAAWSLSWEAHIEVEYRGYAVWIAKVR